MNRSRKMIFVAHCILNVNVKVEGLATTPAGVDVLVTELMRRNYGLVQLPCVEIDMLGCRRWGVVKEQLQHQSYRARCRTLLRPLINQALCFSQNGYELCGIIGIDGSPSCGVHHTCSSTCWGGEIGDGYGLEEKIPTLQTIPAPGVMMEELQELLRCSDLSIPFFALDESNLQKSTEELLRIFLS